MARWGRSYGNDSMWAPYVPAAQCRAKAEREAAKLRAKGVPVAPVTIDGRTIAHTVWGKGWCDSLELHADWINRLARGRTYVRNGSVVDLHVGPGQVDAVVAGSEPYKVAIAITPMTRPAGSASPPIAPARSRRWWNSSLAGSTRRRWRGSATERTACTRSRVR